MSTKQMDKLVLLSLEMAMWSGKRVLDRKNDLRNSGALPPARVASAGSKWLIHSDELSPFTAIQKRVVRTILAKGTRTTVGWLVPKEEVEGIKETLREERDNYLAAADKLERGLPDAYQKMRDAAPDWEHIFNDNPSPAWVRSRFRMEWLIFVPSSDGTDESKNGLQELAKSVPMRVLEDVAAEAAMVWDRAMRSQENIHRRSLGRLRLISNKIKAFSLFSPVLRPISEKLLGVLTSLPKEGPLTDSEKTAVAEVTLLLTDPAKSLAMADDAGVVNNPGISPSPSPSFSPDDIWDDSENMVATTGGDAWGQPLF